MKSDTFLYRSYDIYPCMSASDIQLMQQYRLPCELGHVCRIVDENKTLKYLLTPLLRQLSYLELHVDMLAQLFGIICVKRIWFFVGVYPMCSSMYLNTGFQVWST